MIRKFFYLGLKIAFGITILMVCFLCSSSLVFLSNTSTIIKQANQSIEVDPQELSHYAVADLLFAGNPDSVRMTNVSGLHGLSGFEGYDFSTYCGDTLYSPLIGTGVVTYNGLDGYIGPYGYKDKNGDGVKETAEQNTMLTISGEAGEVTLFHGNYTKVRVGDTVVGGVTPVGINAEVGNATGCHAHIVWKPSTTYVAKRQPLTRNNVQHTGQHGNYGSVLTDYTHTKLSVSHYVPSQGGTNCDGDCTTMASGDKVADWTIGKGGVYAAACPQEWAFGTRFMLSGVVYECRDRGGYINCYDYGDYDPALKEPAKGQYCWVDLLNDSQGFGYGDLTSEWDFVK